MPRTSQPLIRSPRSDRLSQQGFTLIELMVAMLIGLITVATVAHALQASEGRKRTTTSGSDATSNAAMALYTIERDARNAGFGMTTTAGGLSCEIKAKYGSTAVQTFTLAPVVITQGASGAPDTVEFLSSSKEGVPLPIKVAVDHPKTAANFFVQSDLGVEEGDLMVAIPPNPDASNWCTLFQVTNNTSPGGAGGSGGGSGGAHGQNQVLHVAGQSEWNQAGGSNIFPTAGYPAGSSLLNLGNFTKHRYSIVNNALQLSAFDITDGVDNTTDLYTQIIQLQAEYGVDANPSDGVTAVTSWTTTTPTTALGWQGVKAIRIAVVARSALQEKLDKTAAGATVPLTVSSTDADCQDPTKRNPRAVCWAGGAINALNTNNPGANDWQAYRYRVYEAVIPLRNVIWQQ